MNEPEKKTKLDEVQDATEEYRSAKDALRLRTNEERAAGDEYNRKAQMRAGAETRVESARKRLQAAVDAAATK